MNVPAAAQRSSPLHIYISEHGSHRPDVRTRLTQSESFSDSESWLSSMQHSRFAPTTFLRRFPSVTSPYAADCPQLFNATQVMESRQATLLGQDVRLLTYVTIFFLLLAFSTVGTGFDRNDQGTNMEQSLWNINENYRRDTLIWIAAVVACTTYIVTFNLNWLAGVVGKWYQGFKVPLLQRMAVESDEAWAKRGKDLSEFRVKKEPKPSEWFLVFYVAGLFILPVWTAASFPFKKVQSWFGRKKRAPEADGSIT